MRKHTAAFLALALSFLLGIRDGNIALWRQGDAEPLRVFPYRAETLPPKARAALEQGVVFDSIGELEQLAENYLS